MRYFSEFMCSFVMLAGGFGYLANVNLKETLVNKMNFTDCFLAWGASVALTLVVGIRLGGPAYFNPGVAVGHWIYGNITIKELGIFLMMEFLAAGAAVALVMLFFWNNFKHTPEVSKRGIFAAYPVKMNIKYNFFQEIICTFVFLFVLFIAVSNEDCDLTQFGLLGFFALLFIAYSYSSTGFSMNAMRSVFSSVWYTVLPIPNKDAVDWKYQIICNLFGSTIGGILATLGALSVMELI